MRSAMSSRYTPGAAAPTSLPTKSARPWILFLVCCVCLLILERNVIADRMTLLPGDKYDGVIYTVILEHWYHVFTRGANWTDASYFYPYTQTIANTEALLLNGLLYVPFRLAGFDYFAAAHLSTIPLKVLGFFGMYLFCRRLPQISFWWAVFAAAAFTLSNALSAHSSRLQFVSVALVPIIAILMWDAIDATLHRNRTKLLLSGITAVALIGLWCMTAFYFAWFFSFLSAGVLIALAALNRHQAILALRNAVSMWPVTLAILAATALSLFPFAYLYGPKSLETGVRQYSDALLHAVPIYGPIQVGDNNLLFGPITNYILKWVHPIYVKPGEYYDTGLNLLVFALFIAALIWLIRRSGENRTLIAIAAGACLTWIFVIRIGDFSLWSMAFNYIPGAKALRAISAYQIMLFAPVVVIVAGYLSSRRLDPVIASVLGAVLLLGELNTEYVALNRADELARVDVPAPPNDCESFYVTAWNGQGESPNHHIANVENLYSHNVSAMLIAQIARIPTINGIASFNPPDWNFASPQSSDYLARVETYVRAHHLGPVCKLDLNTKRWWHPREARIEPPLLSGKIRPGDATSSAGILRDGWSGYESWGRWTDGPRASLVFRLEDGVVQPDIELSLQPFSPNGHVQRVAVLVNSKQVASLSLTATTNISIPVSDIDLDRSRLVEITLLLPDAISPERAGVSSDRRELGVGLLEIGLKRVDSMGSGWFKE